ncbi:hypothetical protein IAU59_007628 [Kwoniella sp. CBS 9459]
MPGRGTSSHTGVPPYTASLYPPSYGATPRIISAPNRMPVHQPVAFAFGMPSSVPVCEKQASAGLATSRATDCTRRLATAVHLPHEEISSLTGMLFVDVMSGFIGADLVDGFVQFRDFCDGFNSSSRLVSFVDTEGAEGTADKVRGESQDMHNKSMVDNDCRASQVLLSDAQLQDDPARFGDGRLPEARLLESTRR